VAPVERLDTGSKIAAVCIVRADTGRDLEVLAEESDRRENMIALAGLASRGKDFAVTVAGLVNIDNRESVDLAQKMAADENEAVKGGWLRKDEDSVVVAAVPVDIQANYALVLDGTAHSKKGYAVAEVAVKDNICMAALVARPETEVLHWKAVAQVDLKPQLGKQVYTHSGDLEAHQVVVNTSAQLGPLEQRDSIPRTLDPGPGCS
jgi:hypothetical protein